MKKILISAFMPFNKFNNNYSMEVLKYIESTLYDIDKVILDVIYDRSYGILTSSYNLNEYDLIIALGEARSRNNLTIEKQAKNISSCSLADNNNVIKSNEIINKKYEPVIQTKINLTKLSNIADISLDAGKFVCNNLYFHLLTNNNENSLFIHIPECENKIENYVEYARKILEIINLILENN